MCECTTDCPKESDPVCSVFGMQFSNPCEMRKFACRNGIVVKAENKGKCIRGKTFDLVDGAIVLFSIEEPLLK